MVAQYQGFAAGLKGDVVSCDVGEIVLPVGGCSAGSLGGVDDGIGS